MVKKYKRKVGSRRYKDYTEDILKIAVQKIKDKEMSKRSANKIYKIPMGTLSNKTKGLHEQKVGHPHVFTVNEKAAFVDQILEVSRWGFPFNKYDLRILAKTYLIFIGKTVPQFIDNFPTKNFQRKMNGRSYFQSVTKSSLLFANAKTSKHQELNFVLRKLLLTSLE